MFRRIPHPSPALALAGAALFVGLGGGAVAAGIVPLARHAQTADSATVARNAKHLGGKTAAQLAASMRGPKGLQGPAGPAGPAGSAGPKGDTGSTGAAGPAGPQGVQGPKGDKGDVGAGLDIVGTVATVDDLPDSGTIGDAFLVGGDLYVWTGAEWTDAGPVKGPQGDTGPIGATGLQGPQGPQGPKGDPGGVAGYVVVTSSPVALDPGFEDSGTAVCPTGKVAVGGGVKAADARVLGMIEAYPSADGSGWNGSAGEFSDAPSSTTFTVYAVCVTPA